MSANDKFGLGYRDYRYGSILSYENEVLQSVFMNKESDLEDTPVNDRYAARMHTVPPPMTGTYMPSGPDVEINYFKFTYGPKQTLVDESDSKPSEYASYESDSSVDITTSMLEPVENAPKVVCEPKVWTDAPIIEEYESDSDNDSVSNVQEDREKPSFSFTDSVKHVKTSRENIQETSTPNHSPTVEKQDRNGHTRKGLVYAFTRKSCFVCGRFSHLIRDCDFHEKRMTKQDKLIKSKNKVTGQRENRQVWNNVQRLNHQNKFVPSVLTKSGKFPVNAARQNYYSQAASTSTASKDDPHRALKDKGIVNSGCSRHMTGNKAHLADYQEFKGGSVAFRGSNGRINGRGKIKVGKLHFKDVYDVEELKHYNLFSVSQMCDKKNKSFNLKNIDPSGDLACLFVKASIDESNKWHRRLDHVNFKHLKKLVKGNLVRGLPFKIFENDDTCVACQKEKQHKASCKSKTDETTPILKDFIRHAENQFNHKVKTIRSDNGIDFKNNELIEFCGLKWIKREYSNARTPQQNRVAERKNKTLIETTRTMVLVTKPQNKTPYELLTGKQPIISYLRPFGCHVTILNTIDQLGNFDRKSDSGFLVGYSLNSKAFKMFDLDYLTNFMNYEPVSVENQANKSLGPKEANSSASTQANDDQSANLEEINLHKEHFILPIWSAYTTTVKSLRDKIEKNTAFKTREKPETTHENQNAHTNSTNILNTVSIPLSAASPSRAFNDGGLLYPDDPSMPHLKDIYASLSEGIFTNSSYDDEGVVTDFNNLKTTVNVSPTPTTRKHTIHPKTQILRDPMFVVQTRSKVNKNSKTHALVRYIQKQQRNNHNDFQHCLFACFLSQIEPKKISRALEDKSWVNAMQEELLQYQIQKSAFLYGITDEEVYVTQRPGFVDPKFPNKKSWCDEFDELMKNRFQMSSMGELTFFLGLQAASTPIETQKPLVKDEEAFDVDVHLYRPIISSLMYLTASRPDIMFAVCACSRFQVTLKTSHLQAVKRIFRYLKGQLKLGLWYPKVSSFDLESYLDSDYAGVNLDRKSITGGCQFLGKRLISWQCKKQTIVATSTTEVEYVVVA
nr:hypothetical protein [Tanacetum cinerariifolium]